MGNEGGACSPKVDQKVHVDEDAYDWQEWYKRAYETYSKQIFT